MIFLLRAGAPSSKSSRCLVSSVSAVSFGAVESELFLLNLFLKSFSVTSFNAMRFAFSFRLIIPGSLGTWLESEFG